jgi:tRNA threonylcarbamoyladenosine biosynthesis protein TsaE
MTPPGILISQGPNQTRFIAARLARGLAAGSVIRLVGDLGAGKTEFVKGLAKGLDCEDAVTSPTFTLIHEYIGGRLPLFHMDLYRLDEEAELDEIGFEDYLKAGGICAIEWGDKFPGRMPRESVQIVLTILENNARRIAW